MMKQAQQPHPVLCVIAGADANSSLQQLFGALAAEWPKGLTCVVPVTQGQDLSSVAASLTSQSLARSVYSVQTLANEAYTKPDSVLLVPGDSCTTIVDEQSSTLLIKVVEGSQTSLDCFLSGLASKIHHNLVAVVLPGAGTDASEGLKAIKRLGGLTIALASKNAMQESPGHLPFGADHIDQVTQLASLAPKLRAYFASSADQQQNGDRQALLKQLRLRDSELLLANEQLLASRRELTDLKQQIDLDDVEIKSVNGHIGKQFLLGDGATLELLRDSEQAAHKLSRELEDLYRNAPIGLCVIDRDLRYQRINERMAALNGVPASEHLGRTLREIVPKIAEQAEPALLAVFDSGNSEFDVEIVGETPAAPGVKRTWLEQWLPITDEKGDVVSVSIVAEEITDRKRFESSLQAAEKHAREARAAAETANAWKSLFVTNMSHELRTPLAAILGYSDLLAARLSDSENLQSVHTIRRNGKHLLALLDDILDLSRIEAGQLMLDKVSYSPLSLVREIRELMQVPAEERKLELLLEVVSDVPVQIVGDMTRLKQILVNLVGNAIKFTKYGGVTLRVALDPDQAILVFDVIDTGIGIAEEDQAVVFDAFMQADSSISGRFGGSGLGLAISQRLASLLGAKISLESAPDKGSTFSLALPLSASSLANLVSPKEIPEKPAERLRIPRTLDYRILVVDDCVDIRTVVASILTEAGASVSAVSSGRAALHWVSNTGSGRPIDAIVLDMRMPGMNGYESATELRNIGFEAPIVALTANAMTGERDKCLAAGCTDYLSKPVEASQLIEVLHKYLTGPSATAKKIVSRTPRPSPVSVAAKPRSVSLRVLLVEDSDDLARPMLALLGRRGFDSQWAADLTTAAKLALEDPPDIILSDIRLPDGSGYDLAEQLRAVPTLANTAFVAMSGNHLESARANLFDHHLLKPVGASELSSVLSSLSNKSTALAPA